MMKTLADLHKFVSPIAGRLSKQSLAATAALSLAALAMAADTAPRSPLKVAKNEPNISSLLPSDPTNPPVGIGPGDWGQWGGSSVRNNTPNGKNIPSEWNVGSFDNKTGERVALNEIATDGNALGHLDAWRNKVLDLEPGYRSDVLFKAPMVQLAPGEKR